MTTIYMRLHHASCDKVLGWREARDDTRWILTLCDDYFNEKIRLQELLDGKGDEESDEEDEGEV